MRQTAYNALPVNGVGSGALCTCEIVTPELGKIHALEIIHVSDNLGTVERRTKADMITEGDYIELFANNKSFLKLTLAEVFEDIERFNGTVRDGVIRHNFSDMSRQLANAQDATAWINGDIAHGFGDKLTVKYKLKACTDPDIQVRLIWEPIKEGAELANILKGRRQIGKVRMNGVDYPKYAQVVRSVIKDTVNVTKTGITRISLEDEGRNPSWFHFRTTNITNLSVYRGNDQKWNGPVVDYQNDLQEMGYALTAGVLAFSPDALAGGRFGDIFQFRDKRLHIDCDMAVGASFDYRMDQIGDVPR